MSILGVPSALRIAPSVASSCASSVTSHGYARALGSSRSNRSSRSRLRASIATAYPPCAKRRTIAAPVPGPTPVTTATGLLLLTIIFLDSGLRANCDCSTWYSGYEPLAHYSATRLPARNELRDCVRASRSPPRCNSIRQGSPRYPLPAKALARVSPLEFLRSAPLAAAGARGHRLRFRALPEYDFRESA